MLSLESNSPMSLNSRIKSTFWKIDDSDRGVIHSRSIKPFEHGQLNYDDPRVIEALKHHNNKWFHTEIAVKVENGLIEPQYGYAVGGLRSLNGVSIRTRNNLPSPLPTLKAKLFGRCKKMEKAVLIDGSMGINYFHFLSDVLHKIYLLEQFTDLDCPLLVGRTVWSKPFFQFFIRETALSQFDWQPVDDPILAKTLFIARPMPYEEKYWQKTKKLLIDQDAPLKDKKAIFVNRTGTRRIVNFKSISEVLTDHGVEIVDPGMWSVKEQAHLFNSASHIIGIHGAGMTNVAFCDHHKTKVLELCSNNRIGTQYYWLCTALGINWDMMLGSDAHQDQSFELDAKAFSERLDKFLTD